MCAAEGGLFHGAATYLYGRGASGALGKSVVILATAGTNTLSPKLGADETAWQDKTAGTHAVRIIKYITYAASPRHEPRLPVYYCRCYVFHPCVTS